MCNDVIIVSHNLICNEISKGSLPNPLFKNFLNIMC